MSHITMLTQSGNTGHYFADVRLRLLNVADCGYATAVAL